MKQLSQLLETEREQLATRAERTCVVFPDAELPAGCVPARARIGIEAASDGRVMLLVDRGCIYTGDDLAIRNWIEIGSKEFESMEALWDWVDGHAGAVFRADPVVDFDAVVPPPPMSMPDGARLFEALRAEVFGQDLALDAIAAAAARHIAQRDPLRPLTLMALGPTGTGKTATAELLARSLSALTDGEYGAVRLDMVEFQESHTVARLFGSPPGYIGYSDGASLADTLRENPRCVVVIDEIEKAHPNVLVALMAVMDSGRIAGGGRSSADAVEARRAIIMFTSNLAADSFAEEIDGLDDPGEIDRRGRSHLRRHGIKPEIVGRVHRIVGFVPLTTDARARVIAAMIGRTGRAYGLRVDEIAPEVISSLLAATTDVASGARTLGYLIDGVVGDLFADAVRDGVTGTVCIAGDPPHLVTSDTDCEAEE